jgi:oligoendopeptidase F
LRSQIAADDTWDLASIFPTQAAWEAAVEQLKSTIADLARFRGRLGAGPAVLADWMEASERAEHLLGRIFCYASEQYATDTTNQQAGALESRAFSLAADTEAALAFAEPEMLAIGIDTLRRWLRDEPRLAHYGHYLDELEYQQTHLRSAEVEELLGQASDAFASATATHGILAEADVVFAPARGINGDEVFEVGQGSMDALLVHPDRGVRRTAWESYADAHLALKNTMANCMLTGVKQHVFMARARRYASALEASLGDNHIPTQIYYNVIETFRQNLAIWHRYWRLRRRALGYEHLHEYDIKAPLMQRQPEIPFQRAVDWVCAGLRPLGEAYVNTLRRGVLQERWVDWRPNKGKRAGAFSTGMPGTHPFVLMSYTEDIYGLSTLAHELGHSLHSYHTWEQQPYVYAHYSIFCAEVASNLN